MVDLPQRLSTRTAQRSAAPLLVGSPPHWEGVEGVVALTMVLVVAVFAAVADARLATAPLILVGALVTAAAVVDAQSRRIPNRFTGGAAVVVTASILLISHIDGRSLGSVATDVALGVVLSGAPVLFAVWWIAPRLMGGGDWKLLGVCGAAVGLDAPAAAPLIGLVGCSVAMVGAMVRRQREIAFGPPLAVGYAAAVVVARFAPQWVAVSA